MVSVHGLNTWPSRCSIGVHTLQHWLPFRFLGEAVSRHDALARTPRVDVGQSVGEGFARLKLRAQISKN